MWGEKRRKPAIIANAPGSPVDVRRTGEREPLKRAEHNHQIGHRETGRDRSNQAVAAPEHHPWLRDQRDHAIIVGCNDEEISRVSDGGRL